MNFKKQAKQLEHFLEQEFKEKMPLALLDNGNLVYSGFLIKQSKRKQWQLYRTNGFLIDTFNVKSCALIAAKFYKFNNFSKYSELKVLDQFYFKNRTDSEIFKQRYSATKDSEKRDLYLARFLQSERQANYAKEQIASRFRLLF